MKTYAAPGLINQVTRDEAAKTNEAGGYANDKIATMPTNSDRIAVDELSPPTASLIAEKNYGKRVDGTPKGPGFFGEIPLPDGKVATELSASSEMMVNGKPVLYPLLVPTLTHEEIQLLVAGKKPTPDIYQKAEAFAAARIKKGLSPFAGPGEQVPLPKSPQASFDEGFQSP